MIQYSEYIRTHIVQQLIQQNNHSIAQNFNITNYISSKTIHSQILQIKKYLQLKLLKFNRLFYIKYTIQDLNNSNHVQTTLSLNINTLIPKDKINNYKNKIQLLNNLSPISIKIDNNDILETGTYEVKPINDDSAIWVLNIGSDGKVMNFTTPWSAKQETVSDETEAVIEIKNEENIMEEELKMSVENLTSENTELKNTIENFSVEKNNLLLKIEELSNEITAMKSAVDSAVIVKAGQDKYNNIKTEQKSIIALDEIFKNIDSRNKK